MENLLEDMKDFYKDPAHPEDLLQPRELVVDLHCAVQRRNDKKWYRATLTGVEGCVVQAFLLDYGETVVASGEIYCHTKLHSNAFCFLSHPELTVAMAKHNR